MYRQSNKSALGISIAIKNWFSLNAFFFLLFVFYVPKISSRTIKAIQVSYAAVFGYDTKDICQAIAVWVKILAFRSENFKRYTKICIPESLPLIKQEHLQPFQGAVILPLMKATIVAWRFLMCSLMNTLA